MKKPLFAKTKRAIIAVFILISLLVFPSCVVSPVITDNSDEATKEAFELINGVYEQNIITANFLVEFTSYQTDLLGVKTSEVTARGSGVAFSVDSVGASIGLDTYYLLTNNHVVYADSAYDGFECVVTDCFGVSYEATVEYADPDYDLAVVSFKCREEYSVLSFSLFDVEKGDLVVAMGSPLGVINAVTAGSVKGFFEISLSSDAVSSEKVSNVEFEVIKHDAYVNNGSSGGVLLNKDYKICGINYAAELDDSGNSVFGYAVPVTKVVEFISMNEK
ncbi:MAG: trypsin-like peptidase domain-containing protein [Clostridia bacterium]|nr:trypsin-like peptidase domain-containing protein [Clostridia bacterium]